MISNVVGSGRSTSSVVLPRRLKKYEVEPDVSRNPSLYKPNAKVNSVVVVVVLAAEDLVGVYIISVSFKARDITK